jgi:hypothetical protein
MRWLRLRAGSGWALYTATMSQSAAPVAYSLDYPLSPINFNAPETPDQLVRIYGVKHLLP